MKLLLQVSSTGHRSNPPEKRFVINPGRVAGLVRIIIVSLAILLPVTGAKATTVTWLTPGPSTNDWTIGTNWSSGFAPTNGNDVLIANANVGVLLTNATYSLSSIVLSNKCTLIFSNWDTALSATNVFILSNASMTCIGFFTNNAM
ncbi:MAG: hypothetical protein HYV35_05295, partial [Lentisphaerae bacterium]|nr:hypothetical protein [Lentisphaerota bacterium]